MKEAYLFPIRGTQNLPAPHPIVTLNDHRCTCVTIYHFRNTAVLILVLPAGAMTRVMHAFPLSVAALLKSHASAEGAVDGATGLAWAFSRKELHVWRYTDGPAAIVFTRTLPYPSSRRHFVSLVAAEVRVWRPTAHDY